jgi:hypothetical protein
MLIKDDCRNGIGTINCREFFGEAEAFIHHVVTNFIRGKAGRVLLPSTSSALFVCILPYVAQTDCIGICEAIEGTVVSLVYSLTPRYCRNRYIHAAGMNLTFYGHAEPGLNCDTRPTDYKK